MSQTSTTNYDPATLPWRVDAHDPTRVVAWHRAGQQVIADCYVESRHPVTGVVYGCNQSRDDAKRLASVIVAAHNAHISQQA